MRNLSFAVLAVLLLATLVAFLLRYYLRARRSRDVSWEDLLKQLTWLDRDAIASIAADAGAEGSEAEFALDSSAIWKLLGGLEGLEILEHNCHVLVEMAGYLQRWYPEALMVAEQLRLGAREIDWHVDRLKGAAETGNLQVSFGDYAQRAVVTYYIMTRNLLKLYEHASFPGLPELQRAI